MLGAVSLVSVQNVDTGYSSDLARPVIAAHHSGPSGVVVNSSVCTLDAQILAEPFHVLEVLAEPFHVLEVLAELSHVLA